MIPCFTGPTKNGYGLFSNNFIIKGTIILTITGKVCTVEEVESEGIFSQKSANAYRYDKNHYISCEGSLGDFINHACDPNVKIIKNNKILYVVALKNIPKQAELLLDYSTIMAKDDPWFMKCACGYKKCRKMVSTYNLLPNEILERYLTEKIIPQYILEIE